MKRTLTGILAASMVLGTIAPTAFAATKSTTNYQFKSKTITFDKYTVRADGFAAFDGTTNTTYMPIWYVIQGLNAAGYQASWDGTSHTFKIQTPNSVTPNLNNVHIGKDVTKILLNGTEIETAPTLVAKDPASGVATTYMPIYYVQYTLQDAQVHSTWDGSTWNIAQTPGATVAASDSNVGVGQKDTITAALTDTHGNEVPVASTSFRVTDANGNATTGAIIDPATGVFMANAAGTYIVTATADGILGSTRVVVYGGAADLKVSSSTSSVVANGKSMATVTVAAVDANGNVVPNYNGTATVSLSDGSGTAFATDKEQATDFDGQTLQFKNGQATFVVKAGTTPGLSSTYSVALKLADGTTKTEKAVFNTAQQVATALKVATVNNQQFVQANSPSDAQFTVGVVDQDGQPMLAGTYPYNIAVTGAGTYTGSQSGVYLAGSTSQAPITVKSQQGVQGTITVTATGATLTSGSASVNAVVAQSVSKVIATPEGDSASFAEDKNVVFDLSGTDANGYPTGLPDGLKVSAVKDANGNDASDTLNAVLTGKTLAVSDATVGTAQVGANAGVYTVTISDATGKVWATVPVTETAGDAYQLVASTPSAYVTSAAAVTTVKAQLKDQFGNVVAEAGVPVSFTVNHDANHTGTATLNGADKAQVNTDATGAAQVQVAAQPYAGEQFTVTATADPSANLHAGNNSDTANFTVEPTVVTNASVALTSAVGGSIVTAGDTINGSIQLKDQYGNLVAAPQTVTVTTNGGLKALKVNGVAQTVTGRDTYTLNVTGGKLDFTAEAAQAGLATVSVSDGSIAPAVTGNGSVSVIADTQVAGYGLFTATGQEVTSDNKLTVVANTPVELWLKPVDKEGNAIVTPADATVTLADDATQPGQFHLDGSNITTSTATVKAGAGSVAVWYVNSKDGQVTLTAK